MNYKFSDTELKKLLKDNFVILVDTKEQSNFHITSFFEDQKIKYKTKSLDVGDYTAMITKRPEMGIYRDLYFPVTIERKNSIDEIAGNLAERTETKEVQRLIRELARGKAQNLKMFLLLEDANGLENIRHGRYRSLYKSKSLMGRISSIEDEYLAGTVFTSRENSGYHIARKLYYSVRNFLKAGDFEISPEEIGGDIETLRGE